MDPRAFGALMDRHMEAVKMGFRQTATLAALYVNAHLPKGQERVSPEDFVPGEKRERATLTPAEQAMIWRGWAEAHNRTVK